jgi:hypothetical protein
MAKAARKPTPLLSPDQAADLWAAVEDGLDDTLNDPRVLRAALEAATLLLEDAERRRS